jgi:hypothetical protein
MIWTDDSTPVTTVPSAVAALNRNLGKGDSYFLRARRYFG